MASALAEATVAAEQRGRHEVGAAHLLDYMAALRSGQVNGHARPQVVSSRSAVTIVDADGGTAQVAFDTAFDDLVERAHANGVAILATRNSYTAGELAHYTSRVADEGLVGLAFANSPAIVAGYGSSEPITGTNPISFAVPHPTGPRVFDQATSATAWVKVRDAASRGEAIPVGWALDSGGRPTTDARAAMSGALLPFGGVKGSNIAIMVELLAAMAGGSFSLEATPLGAGSESPSLGLLVVAIDPSAFDPDYPQRAEEHLRTLSSTHGADFGRRKALVTEIELTDDVYQALVAG